jgi:hypothetical protein
MRWCFPKLIDLWEFDAMLEKLIIRLEQLNTYWGRRAARKRHARLVQRAKAEISQLARRRLL